ncbi:MAG: nucleotidyltransferase domain-containing protein [Chitinophagaceae bacterium]
MQKTNLVIPIIHQIANEYKANLQTLYGNELVELILFGSYARGDFGKESDVDFAVVLGKPVVRPAEEILRTSPISVQLELKYGMMLSILPVSMEKNKLLCKVFIRT